MPLAWIMIKFIEDPCEIVLFAFLFCIFSQSTCVQSTDTSVYRSLIFVDMKGDSVQKHLGPSPVLLENEAPAEFLRLRSLVMTELTAVPQHSCQ